MADRDRSAGLLESYADRVERALRAALDEEGDAGETPAKWTGDSVVRTYADGSTRTAVYIDCSVPEAGYGEWGVIDAEGYLLSDESLEAVL